MRLLAALAMVLSLTIVEATQRYAAQPVLPDALLPRYFIDKSIPIAKRRIGNCKEDQHPCQCLPPPHSSKRYH